MGFAKWANGGLFLARGKGLKQVPSTSFDWTKFFTSSLAGWQVCCTNAFKGTRQKTTGFGSYNRRRELRRMLRSIIPILVGELSSMYILQYKSTPPFSVLVGQKHNASKEHLASDRPHECAKKQHPIVGRDS